jgi:hypothetical protein
MLLAIRAYTSNYVGKGAGLKISRLDEVGRYVGPPSCMLQPRVYTCILKPFK